MTTIIIPSGTSDPWRAAALDYVVAWYRTELGWPIVIGSSPAGEAWSKGAAIAAGIRRAGPAGGVLVLADADSFMLDPRDLRSAIELVSAGTPYVVPHRQVYRLRDEETARLTSTPGARPRLGWTARPPYEGPVGGGITVVDAGAYHAAGGVDRRFEGWGGEDLAFGWALETLVGPAHRLDGILVHLWHPHPAPDLRGSAESEELVARYAAARGVRRRMTAVISGDPWTRAEPLDEPVEFAMRANRRSVRLPCGQIVRFSDGRYSTADPDEVEQLRRIDIIAESARRG